MRGPQSSAPTWHDCSLEGGKVANPGRKEEGALCQKGAFPPCHLSGFSLSQEDFALIQLHTLQPCRVKPRIEKDSVGPGVREIHVLDTWPLQTGAGTVAATWDNGEGKRRL